MRIAVVAPVADPPMRGGAERAWAGLRGALIDAGHDAEMVTVTVQERTLAEVAAGYRDFSELDVSAFDLVISSKYPAWMCSHPRHVLWMFHPLRGLYDTYHLFGLPLAPGTVEAPTAALLRSVDQPPRRAAVADVLGRVEAAVRSLGADHPDLALPGPVSRRVVHWLDRVALDPSEMSRHVALSRTIATRPGYFPDGVVARVAYAPSDLTVAGATERHGGGRTHLFTASRLDGPKRVELLVRAMAHVRGETPLLIGGHGPEEARLRSVAADDPRIRFLGFVSDEDLAELYASAVAVGFCPLEEDYGLITVEAMAAGAPVVTCTDSGGPAELVAHGVEGLVTEPDPQALGSALGALIAKPARARAMGAAGRRRAARVRWPAVIRTLLGPDTSPSRDDSCTFSRRNRRENRVVGRAPARRPRVVVLTTFRAADRGHGGQLRSFNLYGALARHADVEIVSLTDGGRPGSVQLRPGLVETAVPRSDDHRRAGEELSAAAGLPVTDLVAGAEIARTPAYLDVLQAAADGADVAILAEPYLLPALDRAGVDLPFIYDAFNVEADLKADVLPNTAVGTAIYEQVVAVEQAAAERAAIISACSAEDAARLVAIGRRRESDAVVVPNGTDCRAFDVPSADDRRRRGERWLARYQHLAPRRIFVSTLAVFFGSWHPPNLSAAETLLDLAGELPDVALVLGGRHGDAFADRATPPNVVFTGVVTARAKDVLLRSAHVALNPVESGSGTNLKVIEYLAAGVPAVSTPFGARGLDVVADEHLLVVEPDDLAGGIRAIRVDPEGAARRAVAGRALAETRYDWAALGDRLAVAVGRAAASGHGMSASGRAAAVR